MDRLASTATKARRELPNARPSSAPRTDGRPRQGPSLLFIQRFRPPTDANEVARMDRHFHNVPEQSRLNTEAAGGYMETTPVDECVLRLMANAPKRASLMNVVDVNRGIANIQVKILLCFWPPFNASSTCAMLKIGMPSRFTLLIGCEASHQFCRSQSLLHIHIVSGLR